MLGRLIQGYARGSQLESATDETHTRTLLWPEVHLEGRSNSASPPTTPFGSPTVRISPFDDRAGLEWNETRDLRLIVAQDAFGTNDRPLLLFDTHPVDARDSSTAQRTGNLSQPAGQAARAGPGTPVMGQFRNRSSTISGGPASWTRTNKESETTDHLSNILDCMFGVSSAAKSGSSTKLHFLPGDRSPLSDLSPRTPTSNAPATAPSRTPLVRAKTAINAENTHTSTSSVKVPDPETRDAILVTRMFPVALPEAQDDIRHHRGSSAGQSSSPSPMSSKKGEQADSPIQAKKPKLVEKKTPVFAMGLLFYLPRPGDVRPSTSSARPPSRASFTASSTPNSQASGSFSSWTFLNAIPEHLWTDEGSSYLTDKGMEIVVRNWDVILRSLAVIEALAHDKISGLLQEVDFALISSAAKAPKGPYEQRTNQRNIYLRTSNQLSQFTDLQRAAKHTLWRISYALRIPRVLTGLGLDNGGHWLDEARYLVRLCGTRQQNFFLFNLLTAFLGSHTEWLERLGPDRYRKQFRALHKGKAPHSSLASRTVIICDNRSTARRIIFLLASFLPRNALAKQGSDFFSPLLTPDISSSSPANRGLHEGSLRRHAHNKSRDGPVSFPRRDISGLSTSDSSSESVSAISRAIRSHTRLPVSRSEIEPGSSRQTSVFAPVDGQGQAHKTNATSSTATSGLGTPVPHFATKTDSYFPETVIVDGDTTVAEADLARILRRDSTSHARSRPPSINWGSLVSNVSGLWSKRQDSTGLSSEISSTTATGSLSERRRLAPRSVPIQGRLPSQLEAMVDEATRLRQETTDHGMAHTAGRHPSIDPSEVRPPQLTVDDKDGVIDVDLNLPGFISWNDGKSPSSSLQHHSPSFASTDEGGSSYSSRSFGVEAAGSNPTKVAGYLKRYHEDFVLQGVKAYPELQAEVEQSMSREEALTDVCCIPLSEQQSKERWSHVCTTLLADFRTFTIQRLTLKRMMHREDLTDEPAVSGADPNAEGISGSAASSRRQSRAKIMTVERFEHEKVMDFDTTLTDAIERVLNETEAVRQKPVATSRTHSRTASAATTTSARSMPLAISGSGKTRAWHPASTTAQSGCRQAVVGALEEVVKSVNDDLARHHRRRGADGQVTLDGNAVEQEMKQDNVLREGVKKWLLNVETRSVW
ncbi:hypothetical protein G647_07298 [Cladophialophora carrionii CBS 160.54]|uniref:Folliculin-interacting protein N-terminal domain-containing protein n=1 Tax=Cladophialophora carrionii CBS 160.54 TaxID=1279043 RepID=V9D259_9EURO|nr:uncharacterized protein G647_07298 [Cladophialophora carrionii CBS 160.54]ETI20955.1 hypothetical protein G647_07298 [Cladophialophora carrionii CBS 160.54]